MPGKSDGSWRCAKDMWKFCPAEGCPKWYGCARDHGWKLGEPSPPECDGATVEPINNEQKGYAGVKV